MDAKTRHQIESARKETEEWRSSQHRLGNPVTAAEWMRLITAEREAVDAYIRELEEDSREKAIRECIAVLSEYRSKHSLASEISKVDDCIAEIEALKETPPATAK